MVRWGWRRTSRIASEHSVGATYIGTFTSHAVSPSLAAPPRPGCPGPPHAVRVSSPGRTQAAHGRAPPEPRQPQLPPPITASTALPPYSNHKTSQAYPASPPQTRLSRPETEQQPDISHIRGRAEGKPHLAAKTRKKRKAGGPWRRTSRWRRAVRFHKPAHSPLGRCRPLGYRGCPKKLYPSRSVGWGLGLPMQHPPGVGGWAWALARHASPHAQLTAMCVEGRSRRVARVAAIPQNGVEISGRQST